MKNKLLNLNTLNIFLATILSISYTSYFLLINKYSLGMPDAISRLNIARRLVDNITPGFAQLGGIWLPIPQVFYVPLVQIEFLYRTGLAAALVNGLLFILGSYFVFKIVEACTNDRRAALISGIAYSTSSNLLFFQTTGMSETSTITFILGAFYYLVKWGINDKLSDLVIGAVFITLVSLTRYEGFAVLGISYICVLLICIFKKQSRGKIESNFLIFSSLGTFGFFLWTLYLTLIFGDPLYWIRIYTNSIALVSYETKSEIVSATPSAGLAERIASFNPIEFINNFGSSLRTLSFSIIEMSGLIVTLLGLIGMGFGIFYFVKHKKIWGITFLILFGPLFFLIMNILGSKVPIIVPEYNLGSIFEKGFSLRDEYNVRYGLQLLPVFVIFIGFLSKYMRKFSLIIIPLLLIQFISPFHNVNFLFAIQNRPPEIFSKYGPSIEYINQHYDDGKILMSVLANDSIMFHIKVPYKSFIFEGNNKIFVDSVNDPSKYAKWVVFKNMPKAEKLEGFTDRVGFYLQDTPMLLENYDLVYKGELLVYKKKTPPRYKL